MVSCELAGRHSYQLAPQEEHTMKPVGWRAPLLLKSLNHSEIRQNNWSYTRDKEQTQPFLLFLAWMLYGRKRWDFTMPAQLISFSVARRLHNYWQSTKETKKNNQKDVTKIYSHRSEASHFCIFPLFSLPVKLLILWLSSTWCWGGEEYHSLSGGVNALILPI